MTGPVLSRQIPVADIRGPAEVEVVATPDERSALAAEYDLPDVISLTSSVRLSGEPGGGIDVEGRVQADIVQSCVVTLVPVEQHIDEPFAIRFVRPGSPEILEVKSHGEVVVDPAAPDPPEVLAGSTLDLGPIIEEAFLLAIDPYPRAPGAVLPAEVGGEGEAAESPFAVLGRLKPKH